MYIRNMENEHLFLVICICFVCFYSCEQQNQPAQQNDYIIEPHNFEAVERKKEAKAKKIVMNRTDSLNAYLKKMSHDFKIQKKQYDALKYIYEKYDAKEQQAKARGKKNDLKKLSAQKNEQIKLVLGDALYNKKKLFDRKYAQQNTVAKKPKLKPAETDLPLEGDSRRYLSMLSSALSLQYDEMIKLKEIIRKYDKAKMMAKPAQLDALKQRRDRLAKQLLGDTLFKKMQAFDESYQAKK